MSTPSLMSVCLNVEGQGSLLWLVGRLETGQSVYLTAYPHAFFYHTDFVGTQNFLQTCPTPTCPFKIQVIYFWYFRTHLASTCTKWIEINHRCSQTQFKAKGVWCSDAACGAWGRGLVVPLSLREMNLPTMPAAKQMLNAIFSFHLFSPKVKNLFGFLSINKHRY